MNRRKFLISMPALSLICLTGSNLAQAQVTNTVLTATSVLNQGDCPAVITFKGTITSNSAGTVSYIFTRNDGAIDTVTKTLVFRKPGTLPITTTWTLGNTTLPFYKGWQAIKILSPNPMTSAQANFELHCNPPINSAISAHGNTDWHVDTANEFLYGVDMAGNFTAPNHAPDSWTKRHMHVGQTSTSSYYYDRERTPAGADTNAASGIDRAMLFFYAGHGNPTVWSTLGDSASQGNMSLANIAGGGMLRYYWQCSCEVFAHGPKHCAGGGMEYSCPQSFTGSSDSEEMRDVFRRWGTVLTPDLRMACGMSTPAYCHESNVDRVWDNYNNHGMSVADSFINGFGDWGVVPLCMTMGGPNIAATPLYDTTFTNRPNTSGNTHYHIRYPSGSASITTPSDTIIIPKVLPRFRLAAADVSPDLRRISAKSVARLAAFAGGKATVRIEPESGSVFIRTVQAQLPTGAPISESQQLARARQLVTELGWHNSELGEPVVTRMMNASMPINGGAGDIRQSQDSVLVTYKRRIEVDGKPVDILGGGGVTKIRMANDGSILSISRVWRKLVLEGAPMKIKGFREALKEALARTGRSDAYRLNQWKFGYREPSAAEGNTELRPVFQFAFMPKNAGDQMDTPPRLVEIPAEKQ